LKRILHSCEFKEALEDVQNSMNPDYEKCLLRQLNANFTSSGPEAKPFSAALPLSVEVPGSSNDTSPIMGTPAKRRRISFMPQSPWCMAGGDRFIPVRAGNNWKNRFAMITESGCHEDGEESCEGSVYSCMLKNELLGASIQDCNIQCDERRKLVPLLKRGLFQYTLPDRSRKGFGVDPSSLPHYSLSPVSAQSEKLLKSERELPQKVSPMPFMTLYTPELLDDFHLNLVDWSSKNIASVGLGSCVYLWYIRRRAFPRLRDFSRDGDFVISVAQNEGGNLLAVGTDHGYVQVWDVAANEPVNKMEGRLGKVCSLAWDGDVLPSGSSDTLILQHDVRMSSLAAERSLVGDEGGVCSLKWSPDKQYLASGGSDKRLLVWNMHSLSPLQTYTQHLDAVKAIAWSPRHHGLLASGGGMADRCIRFSNTHTCCIYRVGVGTLL
jgi:cell division cycle 20-like protein 1 (cofactor of APC complex)